MASRWMISCFSRKNSCRNSDRYGGALCRPGNSRDAGSHPAGSHISFRHSHVRLWTAKRPAPLAGSDAKPGFETLPE